MHTTPPKDGHASYSNDGEVIRMTAESEVRDLTAEEGSPIYKECIIVEVQVLIEESFVDMQQIGNRSGSNGIKISPGFLKTIAI